MFVQLPLMQGLLVHSLMSKTGGKQEMCTCILLTFYHINIIFIQCQLYTFHLLYHTFLSNLQYQNYLQHFLKIEIINHLSTPK